MNFATIFNIQKFSLHDGPGIRTTVFFKGCPLRCRWCHNPEGLNTEIEILYNYEKCTLCGACVNNCPEKAISMHDAKVITDVEKCKLCNECSYYCINGARDIAGKKYSVEDVFDILMKDKIFYEQSKGGITLSGGEPMLQIDFVYDLLKMLKSQEIYTAVDTSGIMPFEYFEKIAPYTDLFLYDIKHTDDELHKKFTGVSNKNIIENLKKLSKIHKNINIRMPIIEGVNAYDEHIDNVIEILKGLDIKNINLLAYHDISRHKYKQLNLEYDYVGMDVPSTEKLEQFKSKLESHGYNVKIGG